MRKMPQRLLFCVLALSLTWVGSACATDHSEFIEGPFKSGPEVTETCLECHEDEPGDEDVVHPPYEDRQCNGCHDPHGTVNIKMINASINITMPTLRLFLMTAE